MSRVVTLAGFAAIAAVLVLWSVVSARRANSVSLARALSNLTRTKAGRVTLFLVWAWLGLHLFARGSGAFKR